MVYSLAGEGRGFEGGGGSDVEDCACVAGWGAHGVVQHAVCDEHVAVDVCVVHGDDVGDFEIWEGVGGA